ncbi:hypothetical protein TI05_02150 [Achromatium sp. WMS3]|nr:hypothetical protein TI05_02150 [Achromatium sp. WMS3]
MIHIDLSKQILTLKQDHKIIKIYQVSTGSNGPGECNGSGCTPRGKHRIRLLIGAECPINTVFVERRPTGEIYNAQLAQDFPNRDWILTRIIWLTGLESGKNRGSNVDTLRRFIYIHGTPEIYPLGIPASHGCIRMHNQDLLDLFGQVQNGTEVNIEE